MIKQIFTNIILLVLLVLIQGMILDHIQISVYLNPYLYILFILILPFETAKWLLLLSSFILGMSVDVFSNTLGLNTIACLFVAYCRRGVLNLIVSKNEYEPGIRPAIADLGFAWFFSYSAILIIIHHSLLFFLEVFTFNCFLDTLCKIFVSSAATLFLCIISQYIIFKRKK